jgi:O-antigen/teichoic acid export membrane protein
MSVIKHSIIYLGSSILNKAIPFLLLPILTKHLSPEEYGTLAIFQIMITFYSAFVGMNIHTNVSKNFFTYTHKQVAKLIGNILVVLSFSTLSLLMITFIVTFFFDEIFSIHTNWIRIMPILSFMFMVNTINLTILRNKGKAYTFGIFEIANTTVNMSITILLLLVYHLGWYSQAIGITITYFLFFIIAIIYMWKKDYLTFDIDRNEIKSILSISIPLIPHVLAGIIIIMSDRLFIEKMVSLEMVGIYSVGYMFGMVIMLFTDAFIKSWSPWFYKSLTNPTNTKKEKIVKYTYIYIIGIFILAISISILAKFILPYFVDEKFYGAKEFILWISLGYAVRGVYQIYFPYLVHISKTSFLAISTFVAAIINLLLNYFLINIYGAVGAAYATIIAFFIAGLLVFWYQNKHYDMPWFKKGTNNE